jgi:hypothetical protein
MFMSRLTYWWEKSPSCPLFGRGADLTRQHHVQVYAIGATGHRVRLHSSQDIQTQRSWFAARAGFKTTHKDARAM